MEYCDNCQEPLEPGQIGLCDGCQPGLRTQRVAVLTVQVLVPLVPEDALHGPQKFSEAQQAVADSLLGSRWVSDLRFLDNAVAPGCYEGVATWDATDDSEPTLDDVEPN